MSEQDFELGAIQVTATGMDAFFESDPAMVTPLQAQTRPLEGPPAVSPPRVSSSRRKIGSLTQLDGFVRTASDQLVHKANQDLWSLQKGANGEFFIERLFDDQGGPLKG
jgi:hypothetical protein